VHDHSTGFLNQLSVQAVDLVKSKFILKLLLLTILSGVVGLAIPILVFSQVLYRNEPIREWVVSFYWAFWYYLLSAPIVYLPAMLVLRQMLKDCRPAFVFPLVASLCGVVPVGLFIFGWGGTFRNLFSADVILFYVMVVPVGLLFGIGFVWLCRSETYNQRLQLMAR
jgi:hypothetical protein